MNDLHLAYNSIYLIKPGGVGEVKALADPFGLQLGIIYEIDSYKNIFKYQRFRCRNYSHLKISSCEQGDFSTYGGEVISTLSL